MAYSSWKNGTYDIVEQFISSCKKYKVKPGLYYNMADNAFFNIYQWKFEGSLQKGMVNVTFEEYLKVMYAQLSELWGKYAPEELYEVWFDGGYQEDMKEELRKLIQKY